MTYSQELSIEEKQKKLKEEITSKSSQIFRDSYQMSIGELINLYRDEELEIHPEFQRVFRWNEYQKTKLIESIMLNIPIPSIFVSQNELGIWDVIDGVQRLSTIFEFVGVYKDDSGEIQEGFTLERTDYLPSFEGMTWQGLSSDQKIDFKRSRIDVIIVKKESDPTTKYELFQRLNTGGSHLSGQEVRNCLMIMTNKDFYKRIKDLSDNTKLHEIVPISEQKENERYIMELVLRILIPYIVNNYDELSRYTDLAELLDKETVKLAQNQIDIEEFIERFQNCVDKLFGILGEDSFRKYEEGKHKGPFLVSSFQAIMSGALANYDKFMSLTDDEIKKKIEILYTLPGYLENTKPGARAIPRLIGLSKVGIEHLNYG